MTTTAPPERRQYRSATTLTMRGADEVNPLPAGVIGQVEGIALVYGVVDTYGTTFKRGCLDRTIRERVAAGKVKLYVDHGDVMLSGMYDTHLHIGTVRAMWDAQEPDGTWVNRFRADIFDTEPGRTAHEYLRAIAATNSETGVSIGLMDSPKTTRAVVGGVVCEEIAEVALREISVTGESSVPGTRVTAVRQETVEVGPMTITLPPPDPAPTQPPNYLALLDGLVAHLGAATVRAHLRPILSDGGDTDSDAGSGAPDSPDSDAVTPTPQDVTRGGTEPPTPNVPVEERLAFVRSQFPRLYP